MSKKVKQVKIASCYSKSLLISVMPMNFLNLTSNGEIIKILFWTNFRYIKNDLHSLSEVAEAYVWLKTWFRIKRISAVPMLILRICHTWITAARGLRMLLMIFKRLEFEEVEDAMAREACEINDGDLVENENVEYEIEGDNYAFQILLNMRAHGEAWLA